MSPPPKESSPPRAPFPHIPGPTPRCRPRAAGRWTRPISTPGPEIRQSFAKRVSRIPNQTILQTANPVIIYTATGPPAPWEAGAPSTRSRPANAC